VTLWRWRTWASHVREQESDDVTFHPAHVVFVNYRDEPAEPGELVVAAADVVLVVTNSDVHDLHPADAPPAWWGR
jgi:hypothetical protein